MLMQQILKTAIFFLVWLYVLVLTAYCEETCFIDESPLFLYKTINWWYDSLPGEAELLCGKPVKCQRIGDARVVADGEKRLKIHIQGGIADMLMAFKACGQCYGPSYFKNLWLNTDFLKDATAVVRRNEAGTITGFFFDNVQGGKARLIQAMEKDLLFVLEGRVGGLSSGQIALHGAGPLLKRCPIATQTTHNITLTITDTKTHTTLAIFRMVWDR